MTKINTVPLEDRAVLHVLDGWKVRQYFNKRARRWYVTISSNSPLAKMLRRNRLLRSHFIYMIGSGIWEIGNGYVVHHRDFNSRNDMFDNLERLTTADHDAYHKRQSELFGQRASFEGRKHTTETITKMSKIAQLRGNNDIWDSPKSHHHETTKKIMSEKAAGAANAMFRGDLDVKAINDFYEDCRSLKETAAHFGCSISAIRYRLNPDIYNIAKRTVSGRERTYRFSDSEMVAFYEIHGGIAAAEKYGCSAATIYYRTKAFHKENCREG